MLLVSLLFVAVRRSIRTHFLCKYCVQNKMHNIMRIADNLILVTMILYWLSKEDGQELRALT